MQNQDKLKVLEGINKSRGDLLTAECLHRGLMLPIIQCSKLMSFKPSKEYSESVAKAETRLKEAQATYRAEQEKLKQKLDEVLPDELKQIAELLLIEGYPVEAVADLQHYSSRTIYNKQKLIMKLLTEAEQDQES